MVPEESREQFTKRFAGEISGVDRLIPTYGQMGLSTIFQSLTDAGHGPMVHALANAKADRGFRRVIERGATATWEFQGRGEPAGNFNAGCRTLSDSCGTLARPYPHAAHLPGTPNCVAK
jgi:hypothetical protein